MNIKKRCEYWTILSGKGQFAMDGRIQDVQAGDMLKIPSGSFHSIKALIDMQWIEVQMGIELDSEDSVRMLSQWDEIEEHCRF